MKRRLLKTLLACALVGVVLASLLGAGGGFGFGLRLPDGSTFAVRAQINIQHIPAPEPESDGIMQIRPGETS